MKKKSVSGGSFIRGVSVKEELSVCIIGLKRSHINMKYIVASELKDPICHSDECQIGSFSSEATVCIIGLKRSHISMKYIIYDDKFNFCMIQTCKIANISSI